MEKSHVNHDNDPPDDDYDPGEQFLSLLTLFEQGWTSPAVMATVIEAQGVDGFDRFGRFKRFRVGTHDDEIMCAMECVAEYQARRMTLGPEAFVDLDWQTWERRRFGWIMKDLPSFSRLEVPQEHFLTPGTSVKEAGNNLRIIGALLECLLSSKDSPSPREFGTQKALIDYLVERYVGYAGLGERNLQEKFALAKRSFSMP